MKRLELTQGLSAVVSDVDFAWVNQWKWHAVKVGRTYYAARRIKSHTRYLHQEIANRMGLCRVDHKNRDGLDNRRSQLRPASAAENAQNRRKRLQCSSRFKGVWLRKSGRWGAAIMPNYRQIYLGEFESEVEAARAYDRAACQYYGRFAMLNNV